MTEAMNTRLALNASCSCRVAARCPTTTSAWGTAAKLPSTRFPAAIITLSATCVFGRVNHRTRDEMHNAFCMHLYFLGQIHNSWILERCK